MFILKKFFVASILFFFVNHFVVSQNSNINEPKQSKQSIKHPNIIKINTLATLFNNVALTYERGIKPRFSAGIGVGYKYTGVLPKMFTVDKSVISLDIDKISGYTITPDVRYYLRLCDRTVLDGFYGGLYFRYSHYATAVNFGYFPENNEAQYFRSDVKLNELGVGIQLGYQMLLWKRFSIDFLFFGPRFSHYNFGYKFTEKPDEEFLKDISDHINEIIDRFGFDYNVKFKQEGKTNASTSFSFVNARFGLSLGFAF